MPKWLWFSSMIVVAVALGGMWGFVFDAPLSFFVAVVSGLIQAAIWLAIPVREKEDAR